MNALEVKYLREEAMKTKWDRVRNEDIRILTKQHQ